MRRWVMVIAVAVIAVLTVGLILAFVQRQRLTADRLKCENQFRQLGTFASQYAEATSQLKTGELLPPDVPQGVPPGTIPNLALPADQRLSWVCGMLQFLDQSVQETTDLTRKLDRTAAWDAGANREVSATTLKLFLCPGALPEWPADQPAPTQFIGLAGVGHDAAELPPLSPRAGCFRYDSPTPLALIRENDGLSTTFLFTETAADLGPWIRGGFSTVRGLDTRDGAKPPLGRGGQFGGNYPGVVGFGRADGSAQFFRDGMSVDVLKAALTIAGGKAEAIPGE